MKRQSDLLFISIRRDYKMYEGPKEIQKKEVGEKAKS
jgi:hypothetical protein